VFAGHLRPGDELFLFPDRFARLAAVDREPYDGLVYNLEVDALHNYAVGTFGPLAHNFQVPGSGGGGKVAPKADVVLSRPHRNQTPGHWGNPVSVHLFRLIKMN
jgi:hypothetical protein